MHHYTLSRKKELAELIQSSSPSEKIQIMAEHKLSQEELNLWLNRLDSHGMIGLKRDNVKSLRKTER